MATFGNIFITKSPSYVDKLGSYKANRLSINQADMPNLFKFTPYSMYSSWLVYIIVMEKNIWNNVLFSRYTTIDVPNVELLIKNTEKSEILAYNLQFSACLSV